ncbi:MAG TPA: lysylphosphatidylglycerol synthase domain-containing protein [Candidatus Poseidoniaceae archaeon]|nr:lysylphosphatidylglycerol synthase domain-containing protein [Candidatus Poseidoniaceae archaeon]
MINESKSGTSRKIAIQIMTISVVILSFWFVFSQLTSSEIDLRETLGNANAWLLVAVLCIVALTTVSPLLWKVLMHGSGADIPVKTCYGLWWSTNIAKYIPGKVSLVLSRVWVSRRWGSTVVLESFIWEFLISISSAAFAASFLFFLEDYPAGSKATIALGCLLSLIPILSPKLTQRLVRKPLSYFGKGDWNTEVHMSRKTYIMALFLMTVIWVLWGLAHKSILLGLGYDAPLHLLIGAFAVAWFAGFVAFFLPAGFGARESVFTYTLSFFLGGGVSALLALLSRTMNILVDALLFFAGVILFKVETDEEE